jgi:hypothetical protein
MTERGKEEYDVLTLRGKKGCHIYHTSYGATRIGGGMGRKRQ